MVKFPEANFFWLWTRGQLEVNCNAYTANCDPTEIQKLKLLLSVEPSIGAWQLEKKK